ncbi:MAG TPA: PP2C family protein-serine/threonine phosphatase [Candidatus Acidoferrum sp.]|jgi:serine phosphatase RsbU (regulator of sigma subunit)|nr:PP2C family protein-serine/threonine phosphatase [Candidatus Acidoferrum sp.]
MNTAQPPPVNSKTTSKGPGTWNQISEGREWDDLLKQFTADARASYGFYGKDVDWDEIKRLPRWRRPFRIAKGFFWALVMKLSPARRVMLFAALVMLVISSPKFPVTRHFAFDVNLDTVAALLFLLLLSLELADKVTMKRDLEIAREIQSWLVPSKPPVVAGANIAFHTRPQNSVAGDYYDAFYPLNDAAEGGKLFLVIADVAGKSVPAALLMATFQASLHTVARNGVPLGELVFRLNRYACAHSLDGLRFTTAVLAEFDPKTRRLDYINAGHNAPVVKRHNANGASGNRGVERLDVGGMPFGVSLDAQYQMGTVELGSEDALILFTDGVVEAFNDKGQEFTDAQWIAAIHALPDWDAPRSLQFLLERVDEFVGVTKQFDDITCLVLRCE